MICRPCLAFSSVQPADPSLGVTLLLSPNSVQPVSNRYRTHSFRADYPTCRAGHTTGVDDGIDTAVLDDSERRYQAAMNWLTAPAGPNTDKTRIDLYRDKQTKYTDAFERKIKAFDDALDRAMKDPANNTVSLQRAAYDKWVGENHKTYNNHVQAAYMDWVTLGKKEEVEYYFAIVDNDSAMSRVEASKVRRFINA